MDMRRMQSVLTSEQQRQISEMKKRDEQKLELERQVKRAEKKDDVDSKSGEGEWLSNLLYIFFSFSRYKHRDVNVEFINLITTYY